MNTIPVLIHETNEATINETLAIRRLKELAAVPEAEPAPPGENLAPAATAGGPGAVLFGLRRLLAIFEPYELVRQVGPGKRPLRRHEWETPKGGPPGLF